MSRYFSHEPHTAGSQRSKELAEEIKSTWSSYGLNVDMFEYEVLLHEAKNNTPDFIEVKDHAGKVTIRHEFAAEVC